MQSRTDWKHACIPGARYTSAPAYISQTLFPIFRGSGSETNLMEGRRLHVQLWSQLQVEIFTEVTTLWTQHIFSTRIHTPHLYASEKGSLLS